MRSVNPNDPRSSGDRLPVSALEQIAPSTLHKASASNFQNILEDVRTAIAAIGERRDRSKAFSRAVPHLVSEGAVDLVDEIFRAFAESNQGRSRHSSFDPELFALFRNPHAQAERAERWLSALFSTERPAALGRIDCEAFGEIFGQVGQLTFSFPKWRFPAMSLRSADGREVPALFQSAGLQKLSRSSDKFSDGPDKGSDWLGSGFCSVPGDGENFCRKAVLRETYIEYRRSAILAANPRLGAILIKNSAHFFGRDRFPEVASYSENALPAAELQLLEPGRMSESGFISLASRELMNGSSEDVARRRQNIAALLKEFCAFDGAFAHWMLDQRSSGLTHLVNHLEVRVAAQDAGQANDPRRGYPIVALNARGAAPWFPESATAITARELEELKRVLLGRSGANRELPETGIARLFLLVPEAREFVLLSGLFGDRP